MDKHKILTIQIGGFRRLRNVELNTRPFMVLIGANGVGKTSLLEALSLLSASASSKLSSSLSSAGGIESLLTRGKAEEISFGVEMAVEHHEPLSYSLALKGNGAGYAIAKEQLTQLHEGFSDPLKYIDAVDGMVRYFSPEAKKLLPPDWEHDEKETALSQVPKMYRQSEELRRILSTSTFVRPMELGTRAPVKLPQAMRPASHPGLQGEDLVPYLYYMRETDRDRFEAVTDSIKAAFPGFEELAFPPVAAGMLSMTWKESSFGKPFYMHELSEGTLRFLWLVSLLQSPQLSTMTLIDEPEASMHPDLLSLLADLMRASTKRTQLVVSTHSDRLVRFLKPEEVVVMDMDEEGCASMTWGDELDLDAWLEEYSLDEAWRMGRMGGRP